MGMEYKLIKPGKKEIYDLDKGSWSTLFPRQQLFKIVPSVQNLDDEYKNLKVKVKEIYDFDEEYCNKMVDDIVDWCGKDFIIMDDDCGEIYEEWKISPFYGEYKNTGNRFLSNEYLSEGVKRRYSKIDNIIVNFDNRKENFVETYKKEEIEVIIKSAIGSLVLEDGHVDKVIGQVLDTKLKEIKNNRVYVEARCKFYKNEYINPTIIMFPIEEK
jgi:hypothetical protein